ncbi:MAG: NAD(P)/FAD-dependent oxidoreductase [Pirellulaceae bacterium]
MRKKVVVVGAGLAGLNCARELSQHDIEVIVLEASDGIGGRVRTDSVEGFTVDRGFQVFQTAYPEAQAALDYDKLDLASLQPGALVRSEGRWHRMADPIRCPQHLFGTLFNGVGNLTDRIRLLTLRWRVMREQVATQLARPNDTSTAEYLAKDCGFSDSFIQKFMRPWVSGMFLEPDLATSAGYFEFVFKMLSTAEIAYPVGGMQSIPMQLAEQIDGEVRTGTRVQSVDANGVVLDHGDRLEAGAVVVSADLEAASQLGGQVKPRPLNGTLCQYFVSDSAPNEKTLMLNGDGPSAGPINHVFIPTNTVPSLAPKGKSLISVSVVGCSEEPRALDAPIRQQLVDWFGADAGQWRRLTEYVIPDALPEQKPGFYGKKSPLRDERGIYYCGDHMETSSIQGAMKSGRLAAEAVVAAIQEDPEPSLRTA